MINDLGRFGDADRAGEAIPSAVKPFSALGQDVTAGQIAIAIDRLAHLPARFKAIDLAFALLPHASLWDRQEATNRLMQRWRKLGLAQFKSGRWSLTKGSWNILQASAIEARRAETGTGSVHESAAPSGETPNG